MGDLKRRSGPGILLGLPLCLAVAGGLAGCGVQNDGTSDASPPPVVDLEKDRTYRGHLVWGHEARSFVECDTRREGWVVDATGGDLPTVYRELTSAPYEPLFVEVRGWWRPAPKDGFGSDYAEGVEIVELRRAARESKGCAEDLTGVDYVARGNEPFWNVEIRKTGVHFSLLGRFDRIEFPPPSVADTPTATIFTSEREGEDPGRIAIEVTKRRCTDSMSGSRFSFTAIVRVGDSTLEGCALAGW